MQINCVKRVSEVFLNGLEEAVKVIAQIEQSSDEEISLCFGEGVFVTPLFMSAVLIKLLSVNKKVFITANNYLSTVHFGSYGLHLDSPEAISDCFRAFEKKTYLPILCFSTKRADGQNSANLGSSVAKFLRKRASLPVETHTAISYLISETIDNILEHACSKCGYISCQAYPKLEYIDLCIFDSGISLIGSFRESRRMDETNDDIDAMEAVINYQVSTKNLPGAENRGFGIRTSREMLVNGLGGEYLIYSGNALFVSNPKEERIIGLPHTIGVRGTLVAMRIPVSKEGFMPSAYYQ